MSGINQTGLGIKEFFFIGFPQFQDQGSRNYLFAVFLTVYLLILLGNLLIVLTFILDESLHTPMYMLICSLAILDMVIPSVTLPRTLALFLFDSRVISFAGCFTQMVLYLGVGTAESFLLTLMAYDRYMAICNPLHYPNIMSNSFVLKLIFCCWLGGLLMPMVPLILTVRLLFCGPNEVLHCFCDYSAVLRLACANTVIISYVSLSIGLAVLLIPLFFILLSYVRIIRSVLQVDGPESRRKAFSTCATHLLVISVFILTAVSVYISYRVPGASSEAQILASVVQNVLPPLLNPVIYCLRTKEMRDSLLKTLRKTKILPGGL
ncbi:olfactory receptor 6N1-like [Polyodon spathula]|uniref:olfactory receptor 6N1-like n=1 Tax=Polyodon spathula TaxID=7913 RepID=UPI001B7E180C|nr:olfactory receptor 6N1-like [Polyodon spathula]